MNLFGWRNLWLHPEFQCQGRILLSPIFYHQEAAKTKARNIFNLVAWELVLSYNILQKSNPAYFQASSSNSCKHRQPLHNWGGGCKRTWLFSYITHFLIKVKSPIICNKEPCHKQKQSSGIKLIYQNWPNCKKAWHCQLDASCLDRQLIKLTIVMVGICSKY